MTQFSVEDQWRSFQTFLAAYLAGMLHPRDVLTVSRATSVSPPLVEFRCVDSGALRFSVGNLAWSEEPGDFVVGRREDANELARQTVGVLRGVDGIDVPRDLRVSASGPASSVAVLATGGFMGFSAAANIHPARQAAQLARMTAAIDTDGDPIEAAARKAGDRVFRETRSGSIAALAAASELARLRAFTDPFSPTPRSGYQVGGGPLSGP